MFFSGLWFSVLGFGGSKHSRFIKRLRASGFCIWIVGLLILRV